MKWGKKELWNFSFGLGKGSYSSFDLVLFFFSFGICIGRRKKLYSRLVFRGPEWELGLYFKPT